MDKACFLATLSLLPDILKWVRIRLEKKGIETKIVRRLELAMEEAIVNVIHHGYGKQEGKIEIHLEWEPGLVKIHLKDWGPPFNPLKEAPKVDPNAVLEEREEGGLGIFLMQKCVDEVLYARDKNRNLLILIKRFS